MAHISPGCDSTVTVDVLQTPYRQLIWLWRIALDFNPMDRWTDDEDKEPDICGGIIEGEAHVPDHETNVWQKHNIIFNELFPRWSVIIPNIKWLSRKKHTKL